MHNKKISSFILVFAISFLINWNIQASFIQSDTLTADNITQINQSTKMAHEINAFLYNFSQTHDKDSPLSGKEVKNLEKMLLAYFTAINDLALLSQKRFSNPEATAIPFAKINIVLYLIVTQTLQATYLVLEENAFLRHICSNISQNNFGQDITNLMAHLLVPSNIEATHSQIFTINNASRHIILSNSADDELSKIYQQTSDWFEEKYRTRYFETLRKKVSHTKISDTWYNLASRILEKLSRMYGEHASKIRWRHGYLYTNENIKQKVKNSLRPLDLLVDKTRYVFTDLFLPSYFGHAAIWVGTRKQLEEIGMWNHPAIRPYQKEIEQGKNILEVVLTGTRLNDFDSYFDVDEYVQVRDQSLLNDSGRVFQVYQDAFAQFNKSYDFLFSSQNSDKLICSEIIYYSYTYAPWQSRYIFGRYSFSPDEVIDILFNPNADFRLVTFMKAQGLTQIDYPSLEELRKLVKK
ncbi:MAG: hypothetical protein A2504_01525 [Bdellovibrionales bacterium RIFOXYD12_FULL_39_22]|nr:MAG: hypothetical protein A2385_04050 [Bdellovibrionales bacterium RIFOXYB1_FULL_39_21]OFZ42414.1 MAG: hypothetical protein A2485_15445 [Bdellovibrionales bacterium RIFOXYC12_FULL_39_17]OFZ46285.1 MAG: hypothetical protein A2404_13570 [Bdellovibrionales bacterium RIFOXYC1_FULL_39_130]OFZ70399.1 MAG: hypothetical protein A2451_09585 [Bdellovibrionales bacterium RIFOXYC2_FULL_39_8]OFZ75178.1 MAG: hypothetical protein A2560_15625 [Bdellovibrionales bacterium RIFOXYD1_FULL_39_84]OFZ93172.1 MAG: